MKKRKRVKGKIAMALMCMAVLIFMNVLAVAGEELFIVKKEYRNQRRNNDIQVFYPQIQGLDDEGKDKRINYQIRKDAIKLVSGELYKNDNLWHNLDYKIKFVNGEIISILYKGFSGVNIGYPGAGLRTYPEILTTTVDIEEGKILRLEDIVTDFDTLCEMLIEDEFEGITKWDGVAGNTVSQQYGYPKESVDWIKERMIEGWVSRDATNFDWYTDGSRFVIVISKWNTYDEFAIDLSEVEDILDSEFLEKLGR